MAFVPSASSVAVGLPLDEANPIDGVVRNLTQAIHTGGRGFTLGIVDAPIVPTSAEDGTTTSAIALTSKSISVVESLPPHDEWEPPVAYRDHVLRDTKSFVTYAGRYGTKEASLVFVAAEKCTLVLDEHVARGQRETVDMILTPSEDWRAWEDMLNRPMNHRSLYMFLMRQEHNLPDATILQRFSKVSAKATVDHDSDVQQFGAGEVGIRFKTQAGEELSRFPTTFGIEIPVLDQDVGDTSGIPAQKIQVKLQIEMPSEPMKSVTFTLIAPEWKTAMTRRLQDEIDRIRTSLTEWTVVHCIYQVVDRALPKQTGLNK